LGLSHFLRKTGTHFSGKCSSRLLKNAHFVFARDGRNWLDFEEAFVEQA